MDANTLRKEYTCRLCDRFHGKDIVMAEDGFFYHRECMSAHIKKAKNLVITPKTINCLIEKLSGDRNSDLGASKTGDEQSGGESSCKDAALGAGDLKARRGYNTYFGCNKATKNQSLGFELLVEAANEGSAYKIGSMFFAGVHGFKADSREAKRWLTLAKELSTRRGSLAPSELENITSYLDKL